MMEKTSGSIESSGYNPQIIKKVSQTNVSSLKNSVKTSVKTSKVHSRVTSPCNAKTFTQSF